MRSGIVILLLSSLLLAACGGEEGGGDGGGSIRADGSSTVGPLAQAAAERYRGENPDAQVVVGVSGTGGGFERFCLGETDLSNASRPIKEDEAKACEGEGIDFVEMQIANDALTVVVNKENDWAKCLTVEQLKKIWQPGSKVKNWNEVDAGFPDVPMKLYGPGTDSGTFDYFTDEINGEEGASRSDYSPSEDDNILVQGVAGDRGALGYFGFTYYEANQERLNAVQIDAGDGCVAPSSETAQSGEYKPLSRPLFVYARSDAVEQQHVRDFLTFWLENAQAIADDAQFVPLTDAQLEESRTALESGSPTAS
jgi:phosphate transport system substrate-binding protein